MTQRYTMTCIEIDKQDLNHTQVIQQQCDESALQPGEVLLAVKGFGFSANNITYAAFGERMGYWGFFPASEGYGRMPMWGFASVQASCHDDIATGRLIYGYFPLATHLVVKADHISRSGFVDVAEQRKSIAPAYDFYQFCDTDPGYDPSQEAWQANFRPLFITSFLLDDYVAEHIGNMAADIYLTSASSKTAYGTAFQLLNQRDKRQAEYRVIGLTSPQNVAFTESLGCYDEVKSYPQVDDVTSSNPPWILDFAGNKALLVDLQQRLSAQLQQCLFIGATDVGSLASKDNRDVKGEVFFAPAQYKKRAEQWGADELMKKFGLAWMQLATQIKGTMQVENVQGSDKIIALYQRALAGNMDNTVLPWVTF
ncbi:DUF2855 family protein [Aestuariibacter salexigens]|uniref:DUF2855 family protein n=1 Tax=Aestuariibacter salexigens TaxID=226010 RepID=UPI0003F921D6|nr:DUF2855 family protein [Aestuariibacter salexigens]